MTILYIFGVIILAKVILESPFGRAMADSIRSSGPTAPPGAATRAELEELHRDVEELRERIERLVEEQSFITRLLSEARAPSLGRGEGESKAN